MSDIKLPDGVEGEENAVPEEIRKLANKLRNEAYRHGGIDQQDYWSDKKYAEADDRSRAALTSLLSAIGAVQEAASKAERERECVQKRFESLQNCYLLAMAERGGDPSSCDEIISMIEQYGDECRRNGATLGSNMREEHAAFIALGKVIIALQEAAAKAEALDAAIDEARAALGKDEQS